MLTQEARQLPQLRLSPKLIAFYEMLQLPSLELEQSIVNELQDNPALELQSERLCPVCQNPLVDGVCRDCGFQQGDPIDPFEQMTTFAADYRPGDRDPLTAANPDDDDFDPIARLAAPLTLQENLKWHFRALASADEQALGETLIDCLDDDGYLEGDLAELAEGLGVEFVELERVLQRVQLLDPPGVGARNLRECLLIQLQQLAEAGQPNELAQRMVTEHWALFGRHRYEEIATKLRVSASRVQAAADFISHNLNPYPGRAYRPEWQWQPQLEPGMVRPDCIIREVETRRGRSWLVEVPEARSLALRVNRTYRSLWEQMKRDHRGHSPQDREHVQKYIARAKDFISNINQRRHTLQLIMQKVVEEQREFFEGGTEYLKPLTRLKIAAAIGFHESTIGRAIVNKHALLPTGELMPCDEFFDQSLPVKEVIKRLLADEDARRPYSDEQMATLLRGKGIDIARRTVTKYREAMRVLPASKRRRF